MAAVQDHVARATLRLQGYRSRTVTTSVGEMHVVEGHGVGPHGPIVMLHGFSAAGVHFFPLFRRLRTKVSRLYAPDLPAHGFSEPPLGGITTETMRSGLFETLNEVLDQPAVVLGNSMGGFAAVHYALSHPEKVKALVLVSPGGARMSQEQLDDFRETFKIDSHRDALEFIDKLLGRPSFLRQLFAWGVKRKLNQTEMRNLMTGMSVEDLLMPSQLDQLDIPILLIWGRRDGILPNYHLEFSASTCPPRPASWNPSFLVTAPTLKRPGR